MAREMVAVTEKLFTRSDLPAEIEAVRVEAFRNAYIVAGLVVDDDANAPGARFQVLDRLARLHVDLEMRRQPTSRRPEALNLQLHELVAGYAETVAWLHREVAERDRTIGWLHAEVADRDRTIGGLCSSPAAPPPERGLARWIKRGRGRG